MEMKTNNKNNAGFIELELDWLSDVIEARLQLYFGNQCPYESITEIKPANALEYVSEYANLVTRLNMSFAERLLLILSLAPHLRPQVLDVFFVKNSNYDRGFTEFGGVKGNQHSGFLPTGETFAFIMAGNQLQERIELLELFNAQHFFYTQNILRLQNNSHEEPLLSGSLQISPEYLSLLCSGKEYTPEYSSRFPARRIQTALNWEDLVISNSVREEIEHVVQWIQKGTYLLDDMNLHKHLKPGYRCLFYGPPGTGKTLTAALIGKSVNQQVYRIDLSMIVSKYIGETEKNLGQLFDLAQNKKWILFFDEADALFGKRTQAKDAHDRYANQEVSYLLQRIEDFPGVVILATNLKSNMDEAFSRRFQSTIYFAQPTVAQRISLWKNIFNNDFDSSDIDFVHLASEHQLSGGMMINVLRHAALQAASRGETKIRQADVQEGITRELKKEGKNI